MLCYLYDNSLLNLLDTAMIPSGITTPQVLQYGTSPGTGTNAGPRYYTYSSTVTAGNLTYLVYQHQPSFFIARGKI